MKINEFRKKYFNNVNLNLKQKTIDTIEDVFLECLADPELNLDLKTRKSAAHYEIDTLLEVMDKNLEDYKILSEMCMNLETLEE